MEGKQHLGLHFWHHCAGSGSPWLPPDRPAAEGPGCTPAPVLAGPAWLETLGAQEQREEGSQMQQGALLMMKVAVKVMRARPADTACPVPASRVRNERNDEFTLHA